MAPYRGDDEQPRVDMDELHRTTPPDKIQRWLDDCKNAVNVTRSQGGPGYDQSEKEFLLSVDNYFKLRGHLSPKQLIKLKGMWDRI